jgi:glycine dehydrogenase subunit 1
VLGEPMKFIPNTSIEEEMLNELGLSTISDLFSDIPKSVKIDALDIHNGLSQMDVEKKLKKIAKKNKSCQTITSFL